MMSHALAKRFDGPGLQRLADGLIIAVAVSLPWSTSATGILLALWLLAVLPTLDWQDIRRVIVTPAGGLPLALVLLGVLGTLWADVSVAERWGGLGSFLKLLIIPILFAQFRRSKRADAVFGSYVLSCIVLLVASYAIVLWPGRMIQFSPDYGVLVKNAATQSGEFAACIFGLAYLAYDSAVRRHWSWLLGISVVIAAMLANILFVATGRTALVVMAVLLVLFAVKKLSLRGSGLVLVGAVAVATLAWYSSPHLRMRTEAVLSDLQQYQANDERNSTGERVEFAKKSIRFISEAPLFGHGTGSIKSLFARAAEGKTGAAGVAASNPHNQTFAVAIQLGLVGAAVLWAMWLAHLALFRGPGLVAWIGVVVVVQNIVGSLFNSHLFDFLQGWVYVVGVGVAGGMALTTRAAQTQAEP